MTPPTRRTFNASLLAALTASGLLAPLPGRDLLAAGLLPPPGEDTWVGIARTGDWGSRVVTAGSLRDLLDRAQALSDKEGYRLTRITPYAEGGRAGWVGLARTGDWRNRVVTGDTLRELLDRAQVLFDKEGYRLIQVVPHAEGGRPGWVGIARTGDWGNRIVFGATLRELTDNAQTLFDKEGYRLVSVVPYVEDGRTRWVGIARTGDWDSRVLSAATRRELLDDAQALFDKKGLRLTEVTPFEEGGRRGWVGLARSGDWNNRIVFGATLRELTDNAQTLFDKGGYRLIHVAPPPRADDRPPEPSVEKEMRLHDVPGLAIGVAVDGKVVQAKGFGSADRERGVAVTEDTPFQLASVTKTFTAVAVLKLVEDGKLALDDPVGRHSRLAPRGWEGVTLRHLLTHTSGVPEYLAAGRPDLADEAAILTWAAAAPLDFVPGTRSVYSNTNFVLLGAVIEAASGKTYDRFLDERVFRPLGLKATGRRDLSDGRLATGYTRRDGALRPAPALPPKRWDNADGGLVSSARDLATVAAALHSGALLGREGVAALCGRAALRDGAPIDLGLGVVVNEAPGLKVVGMSGGRPGAQANLTTWFARGRTVSVAVLCNLDLPGQFCFDLGERIARPHLP